jgi:hypothetical protein
MRPANRTTNALGYLTFWLISSTASGGDDVLTITITNNSSDNLLVTVYDQNTTPAQRVLSTTPIYGNASIPVSISPDGTGKGHLSWTAMTADHDMRQCGHSDSSGLNDGDTVNVQADSDCGG